MQIEIQILDTHESSETRISIGIAACFLKINQTPLRQNTGSIVDDTMSEVLNEDSQPPPGSAQSTCWAQEPIEATRGAARLKIERETQKPKREAPN